MPITSFQREVLHLLRDHRNPNSYVAGGVAINRVSDSSRNSDDIDFFHDIDEAVVYASSADLDTLVANGYRVQILINQPSFVRVIVSKTSRSLKLEWVRDTAFRFFPVIEDDELGYRLHDVDLAVNKCLALANRTELRDIIDLVQLNQTTISLVGASWAACGKDPGFTPDLLFDCMRKNSIIRPEHIVAENLVQPVSAVELKGAWLRLLEDSYNDVSQLPPEDLGCLYVDHLSQLVKTPHVDELDTYSRHFGSLGGSWPRVVTPTKD